MVTFRHEIRINRPREAVFPLAADPGNQLKWDPAGMQSVQKLTPGPLARGSHYKGRWKRFRTIDYKFAEYDPPHRYAHDARTGLGRLFHTLTFEEDDGGTRFGQVLEVREPSHLWRVLQPIAKPLTRRRMMQIAQELKSYAEGSPARAASGNLRSKRPARRQVAGHAPGASEIWQHKMKRLLAGQHTMGQAREAMRPVEASVVVPFSPEKTWDFLFEDPWRVIGLIDNIVAVEDYEMRADGTPRYRMVRKFGHFPPMSFVSDYHVFERPRRHVNRILESPLGGNFSGTYEPTAGGTRVTWRWDIESRSFLIRALWPLMRPLLTRSLQQDLNTYAKAAAGRQAELGE
jgi:uncharacterized protein YndB with AHSA1/START domain